MLSIAVARLADYADQLAKELAVDASPARRVEGKVVGVLVDEPSTRTRLSTISGAVRSGIDVVDIPDMASLSIAKGESLADTGAVVARYFDALAVRSARAGLPRLLADASGVPVLNLGDGSNEHPSQALATMVTARLKFGSLSGRSIAIVGDLEAGRVAHSVFVAAVACGMDVTLVPSSPMPGGYLRMAELLGDRADVRVVEDVTGIAHALDVLYVTRDQRERRGGRALPVYPVLTERHMRAGLVLHPLPRGSELPEAVWEHVRGPIIEHVTTTHLVRQRLLVDLLAGRGPVAWSGMDAVTGEGDGACPYADCVAYGVERKVVTLGGVVHCGYCLGER